MDQGAIESKTRNQDWVYSEGGCKDKALERKAAKEAQFHGGYTKYSVCIMTMSMISVLQFIFLGVYSHFQFLYSGLFLIHFIIYLLSS